MPPSGSSSEQPDKARAEEELRALADRLQDHLLLVSAMLLEAGEEILAHMGFSAAHWRQNSSTNLLERLSKEIKRRSRVVGIFPDRSSIIRLVGAVLAEQHDELAAGAQLVVFTTGRGAPMGAAIAPVVKVATNSRVYRHMRDNMDVNAGRMIDEGLSVDEMGAIIFDEVRAVCNGKLARAEVLGHREFAIHNIGPAV